MMASSTEADDLERARVLYQARDLDGAEQLVDLVRAAALKGDAAREMALHANLLDDEEVPSAGDCLAEGPTSHVFPTGPVS